MKNQHKKDGFTLLEVIVTLIVAAILAVMIVQIMGRGMILSAQPVNMLNDSLALNTVMEKITAEYDEGNSLADFKDDVENNTSGFGVYSVDPADGGTSEYIVFNSSNTEVSDTSGDILKITISGSGHTLTALFAK